MRYFDIFLMEEEITQLYLGREDILFRLFLEVKNEINPGRQIILERQINFITKPIIPNMLRRFFMTQHIIETEKDRWVKSLKGESTATLSVSNNHLILEASGEHDAETSFFEILRHAYPNFFAIDYQNYCGGWLSPHKKHILFKRKIVL